MSRILGHAASRKGNKIMACLVYVFKHTFSVFKQHYMYFHTFFHPHVFPKNTNNITKTTLPNGPLLGPFFIGEVSWAILFFFLKK